MIQRVTKLSSRLKRAPQLEVTTKFDVYASAGVSSDSSMATGVNTHRQSLKSDWFIIHLTHYFYAGGWPADLPFRVS